MVGELTAELKSVTVGFVRWMVTATVLTVVALVVGMQVGGDAVDLFGLYTLAAIINSAAVLWAMGIAMRLRSMQAGPLMQTPVFLALFFSVFFFGWKVAIRIT